MQCNWRFGLLTISVGCGAFAIDRDAKAAEPLWWNASCGGIRTCGHWQNGIMVQNCPLAKTNEKNVAETLTLGDITVSINGNVVTIQVVNGYIATNVKRCYLRVEGTGANGPPAIADMQGVNFGLPNSTRTWLRGDTSFAGGNWSVEAWAKLDPQPTWPRLTFEVPSVGALQVRDVWVVECCDLFPGPPRSACSNTQQSCCLPLLQDECAWLGGSWSSGQNCSQTTCPLPSGIPAISEWGLIVMTLLVLAVGTVVIKRHKTA